MTSRETKLVAIGLLIGVAAAAIIVGATRLVNVSPAVHASSTAPANRPASYPAAENAVETVDVIRRDVGGSFETVAQAAEPETQLAAIPSRVSGRIDKLLVNFTGESVHRGQAVALIYSPELAAAVEEYRLAVASRARMTNALPLAASGADDMVASSRRRLELLGLTAQQIEEAGSDAKPGVDLPIYATASGVVTERKVAQGQYVNAGDTLFTVADLGTIWIKADVYEADLPRVRKGQAVDVSSDSLPGRTLRGRVGFIDLAVNQQTRTATVRVEVANPGLRLRPGMFVRAQFLSPKQAVLAVPRSAVVDTGSRRIVYVAGAGNEYTPREVSLGDSGNDFYPVLAGLKEGERVVANGAFLVDSQTRLSGAMSGMFGGAKEFKNEKQSAPADAYKLEVQFQPDPPHAGNTSVLVPLADAAGKPVADAQVKVSFVMPAMPSMNMPEMRAAADLHWDASRKAYTGTVAVPMAGPYNVVAQASRAGRLLAEAHARTNAQ